METSTVLFCSHSCRKAMGTLVGVIWRLSYRSHDFLIGYLDSESAIFVIGCGFNLGFEDISVVSVSQSIRRFSDQGGVTLRVIEVSQGGGHSDFH